METRYRKGFAMFSAISAATLLIIASTAMILTYMGNRVEIRRELERMQVTQGKESTGRAFMEALAQDAQGGVAGTNVFDTTLLIGALASGSKARSNSQSVTIYDYDSNNPTATAAPLDIIATDTNARPMESMTYPAIRFGYVPVGTPFVGRLFQYQVGYSVASQDNLVTTNASGSQTPSTDLVNESGALIVHVIEVPTQLGIEGENISLISNPKMKVTGSIAGKTIQDVANSFSALNIAASVAIQNGEDESARVAGLGASSRGVAGAGNKFVASASGAVFMMPVGPRGTNTYAPQTATDAFTRYWSPFYQCTMRADIRINGTTFIANTKQYSRGGTTPTGSQGTVSGPILRIFNDSTQNWVTVVSRWNPKLAGAQKWENEVEVNISKLQAMTDSIYIGVSANGNSATPPVILEEGAVLTRPFSVVSNGDVYIPQSFGSSGQPFSIIAPNVYYGHPGNAVLSMNIYGQRGITSIVGSGVPSRAIAGDGGAVALANMDYGPVQTATMLPPVYLKTWVIHIEDAQ